MDSPPDLFYPVPLFRPLFFVPSRVLPAIRVPLALRGRSLWDFGAFPVPLFLFLSSVPLYRPSPVPLPRPLQFVSRHEEKRGPMVLGLCF